MATAYLHYIVNTANGRIEGVAIHSEESPTRLSSYMFVEGGWPSRVTAETYHDAHLRMRNTLVLAAGGGGWSADSPVRAALVALGLTGVQQIMRWPDRHNDLVTRSWIADGCLIQEHPAEVYEHEMMGIKVRSEGFPSWTVTALDAVMRPAEQSKTTWQRKAVTHVWAYSTCPAQTADFTRDGFCTGKPLLSYRNGVHWLTPVSKDLRYDDAPMYTARQAMVEAGIQNAEMGGGVSTADAIRHLAKQRDEALAERDAARKEHAYLLMRIREWAK